MGRAAYRTAHQHTDAHSVLIWYALLGSGVESGKLRAVEALVFMCVQGDNSQITSATCDQLSNSCILHRQSS
jgi:hypothetical protein